ncbi:MAG: class I SAM-dependent rRNA methyltransferase [Dysgonamonadaceae bacterium]|jgi:23S rRNA (cytosine1962-C5)-methyltransferase|nr:class I SAM-dependent rRNA methyltransferase [Dysgonamonadaceae bacterium]
MPLEKRICLKPGKEESLKRFHPWLFSGAILRAEGKPEEGDVVDVVDSKGAFLARGHCQIGSIAVRVLSFKDEAIDAHFWESRLQEALNLRLQLGLLNSETTACRLVHGEGDSLPGLIIDLYAETAVIQAHTAGMHLARHEIAEALKKVAGKFLKNIYYKSESTLPFKADLEPENEYLYGGSDVSGCALENGLKFKIDWLKGQKTGFFVDQRDNRHLLEKYSSGRSVLNLFCYTGGFSCFAMRGGAKLVHSVDSSAKAIDLVNENISLNFPDDGRHQAFAADAFRFLEQSETEYDLIILDPPAFAKHQKVLKNALIGYRKLNAEAIKRIKSGGIIFTFSCSQAVNRENFRLAVFSAAAQTGRKVKILHQLTQSPDHPINIYHPESEYLKGLVLEVE